MEWIKCTLVVQGFLGGAAVRNHLTTTGMFPPVFFHHGDNGTPLPGLSPIRMFADGYHVSLLGMGETGKNLILSHLGNVIRAFNNATVTVSTGVYRIRPMSRPVIYDVRSCVLRLPRQWTSVLRNGDLRSTDHIVTAIFGRALRRQVKHLCPNMLEAVATSIVPAKPYRSLAVEVKPGKFLPTLDLLVNMPFRLEGPWQFGGLQARGYGRCRPARRPN